MEDTRMIPAETMTTTEMMIAMMEAGQDNDVSRLDVLRSTVNDWLVDEKTRAAFNELADICVEYAEMTNS